MSTPEALLAMLSIIALLAGGVTLLGLVADGAARLPSVRAMRQTDADHQQRRGGN